MFQSGANYKPKWLRGKSKTENEDQTESESESESEMESTTEEEQQDMNNEKKKTNDNPEEETSDEDEEAVWGDSTDDEDDNKERKRKKKRKKSAPELMNIIMIEDWTGNIEKDKNLLKEAFQKFTLGLPILKTAIYKDFKDHCQHQYVHILDTSKEDGVKKSFDDIDQEAFNISFNEFESRFEDIIYEIYDRLKIEEVDANEEEEEEEEEDKEEDEEEEG